MANDFFQFKQFRIDQSMCGMKVTTEACIFGAVISFTKDEPPQNILDIGSGTGLLSLMLAQRSDAKRITGVEIDHDAFVQSKANAERSPWSDRIRIIHANVTDLDTDDLEKYDLIVSNPPFFKKHQQPVDYKKAHAIHADTLSLEQLADAVMRLLSPDGEFQVLLPEYEAGRLAQIFSDKGLYLNESLKVFNTASSPSVFRAINTYSRKNEKREVESFFIRDDHNDYTRQFVKKLAPFYLHLDS